MYSPHIIAEAYNIIHIRTLHAWFHRFKSRHLNNPTPGQSGSLHSCRSSAHSSAESELEEVGRSPTENPAVQKFEENPSQYRLKHLEMDARLAEIAEKLPRLVQNVPSRDAHAESLHLRACAYKRVKVAGVGVTHWEPRRGRPLLQQSFGCDVRALWYTRSVAKDTVASCRLTSATVPGTPGEVLREFARAHERGVLYTRWLSENARDVFPKVTKLGDDNSRASMLRTSCEPASRRPTRFSL
ncbi:hypothetical protein DFH06DRAFT_696775 [Mycena polygramma]|nr:hypothetical protein DFH06DRAFT_696775 [Mycena polygramma]